MTTASEEVELDIVRGISRPKLIETNRRIAEWVRLSGSRDERFAFEYVKQTLDTYGLATAWREHPALVSYPIEASLQVLDAAAQVVADIRCLSHAFSASVDKLEAEIVDVGFGTAADYAAIDVRGKVVLVNGLASPIGAYTAERAGSLGQVFINDDHLHNMIVSTIWGTPTPQSAERLPKTPAISVVAADGEEIRRRIATSPTRVRIHTQVFAGWQSTPIVVGELPGRASDDFVILSGHLDSWDHGAMDNASANATMLEVAHLVGEHRDQLYRGVRVIFWSGHSHGRYSGSAWYADHFWQELYDRCVAHVNVDSTGARGASYYGSFPAHLELGEFGASIVRKHTGQATRAMRMSRAGDMSFNGIGIPALYMEMSQVPISETDTDYVSVSLGQKTGGKMPWWWHTSEDTIDKVDLDVLETDTRVYASAVWQLCRRAVLPMDFRPVLEDLEAELAALQQAGAGHLDLSGVLKQATELGGRVASLWEESQRATAPGEVESLNRRTKLLSRLLIPVTYTLAGRFDHDPAWNMPFLPGLQDARRLPQMQAAGDEYQFLLTQLVRNRNAVAFALGQALDTLGA